MHLNLLTVEDIAQKLGLGKTTVYKMIKKLKHIRLGRKIYVTEEDLNDYICSHAEIRQDTEHDV
jgi:excisionase family DNA binding protein